MPEEKTQKSVIFFKIEVFGDYRHKQVADDLYNDLKDSGFLEKYPLFSIKIEPM